MLAADARRGRASRSREGLPVMYVTEDTTRARPEDAAPALHRRRSRPARGGSASPTPSATPRRTGARDVVRFMREVVDATGEHVAVDWHGHNDRGLAVDQRASPPPRPAPTASTARCSASASACGNAALDLLLVNFELLGWSRPQRRAARRRSARCVARADRRADPRHYPVVGRDAFRTQTGVHAAAIIKARAKGDDWLADRIYSGDPGRAWSAAARRSRSAR